MNVKKTGLQLSIMLMLVVTLTANTYSKEEIRKITSAGNFSGKIISVSRCDAAEGDKRFCKYIDIMLDSGKLMRGEFYLHVKLKNNRLTIYDGPDSNKSSAEQSNILADVVEKNLKTGTNVDLTASCGGDAACYIPVIAIHD